VHDVVLGRSVRDSRTDGSPLGVVEIEARKPAGGDPTCPATEAAREFARLSTRRRDIGIAIEQALDLFPQESWRGCLVALACFVEWRLGRVVAKHNVAPHCLATRQVQPTTPDLHTSQFPFLTGEDANRLDRLM